MITENNCLLLPFLVSYVHGVAKSRTRLSDWTEQNWTELNFPGGTDGLSTMQETRVQSQGREDLLEKEMATHSSTLAWKIPWTEEPVRLQSMRSRRVRHNYAISLSLYLCEDWNTISMLSFGFFWRLTGSGDNNENVLDRRCNGGQTKTWTNWRTSWHLPWYLYHLPRCHPAREKLSPLLLWR